MRNSVAAKFRSVYFRPNVFKKSSFLQLPNCLGKVDYIYVILSLPWRRSYFVNVSSIFKTFLMTNPSILCLTILCHKITKCHCHSMSQSGTERALFCFPPLETNFPFFQPISCPKANNKNQPIAKGRQGRKKKQQCNSGAEQLFSCHLFHGVKRLGPGRSTHHALKAKSSSRFSSRASMCYEPMSDYCAKMVGRSAVRFHSNMFGTVALLRTAAGIVRE